MSDLVIVKINIRRSFAKYWTYHNAARTSKTFQASGHEQCRSIFRSNRATLKGCTNSVGVQIRSYRTTFRGVYRILTVLRPAISSDIHWRFIWDSEGLVMPSTCQSRDLSAYKIGGIVCLVDSKWCWYARRSPLRIFIFKLHGSYQFSFCYSYFSL